MLEYFITSALRRKILSYLLNSPDEDLHLRELSRRIGNPAPAVKRELDKLEEIGFLLSWTSGNQKRFKLNKTFIFLPEMKAILEKDAELSMGTRVAKTYTLQDGLKKRKSWQKKAAEIAETYGKGLKRHRPRHPAEVSLLKKIG
jgi:hypothetical protein